MHRISSRGLGRRRTEIHPKPREGENPERARTNKARGQRNQPIPIQRTTLTAIEGCGRTGSRIVALLEESFRLQLAKEEAKKLSHRLNKSQRRTT